MLSLANVDFANDTALQMLDGLAIRFRGHNSRGGDRTIQPSKGRPSTQNEKSADYDDVAGYGRGSPVRNGVLLHHRTYRTVVAPLATAAIFGPPINLESTSTRPPNANTRPASSTSTLSTAASIAVLCDIMTMVERARFSAWIASIRAASPSESKLAFGSSSITSGGFP